MCGEEGSWTGRELRFGANRSPSRAPSLGSLTRVWALRDLATRPLFFKRAVLGGGTGGGKAAEPLHPLGGQRGLWVPRLPVSPQTAEADIGCGDSGRWLSSGDAGFLPCSQGLLGNGRHSKSRCVPVSSHTCGHTPRCPSCSRETAGPPSTGHWGRGRLERGPTSWVCFCKGSSGKKAKLHPE